MTNDFTLTITDMTLFCERMALLGNLRHSGGIEICQLSSNPPIRGKLKNGGEAFVQQAKMRKEGGEP